MKAILVSLVPYICGTVVGYGIGSSHDFEWYWYAAAVAMGVYGWYLRRLTKWAAE